MSYTYILYCKFGTEMKNEADIHRSKEEIRNIGLVSPPRWWLKLGHDHVFQGVKEMGPISKDREQQYFRRQ